VSKKKLKMMLKVIAGMPKSFFMNIYYFPFSTALKMPLIVTSGLKIGKLGKRGSVVIKNPSKHIMIGFGEAFALGQRRSYWEISDAAHVVFNGKATFGAGIQLISDGELVIGDDFYCNANCIINSGKSIKIGDHFLCGWNCEILDGDGHSMIYSGKKKDKYREVEIGNHVWIASDVTVLKGSFISDGSVVAAKSCVSKKIEQKNVLIGRNSEILRNDVEWEK